MNSFPGLCLCQRDAHAMVQSKRQLNPGMFPWFQSPPHPRQTLLNGGDLWDLLNLDIGVAHSYISQATWRSRPPKTLFPLPLSHPAMSSEGNPSTLTSQDLSKFNKAALIKHFSTLQEMYTERGRKYVLSRREVSARQDAMTYLVG